MPIGIPTQSQGLPTTGCRLTARSLRHALAVSLVKINSPVVLRKFQILMPSEQGQFAPGIDSFGRRLFGRGVSAEEGFGKNSPVHLHGGGDAHEVKNSRRNVGVAAGQLVDEPAFEV